MSATMQQAGGILDSNHPPFYPIIDAFPDTTITHGRNEYSIFPPAHQYVLFEALKLRCHTEKRLVDRRYLTSIELFMPREGVYVPKGIQLDDIIATPVPRNFGGAKRRVVALDCEMVGVSFGYGDSRCEVSELGQLCAVDVLTGEVLIDVLVQPDQRVISWRTRYSGLTPAAMRAAQREGRLLPGWRGARAELLKHVDSGTILIGHDLQSDLFVLRLAHDRVVDTAVQTAEAVFGRDAKLGRVWGLKGLCRELVGIDVQVGRRGHDCVEDALATRELALWCLCFPRELEAWAEQMREMLERKRIERERKMEEERRKREEEGGNGAREGGQERKPRTRRLSRAMPSEAVIMMGGIELVS